MHDAPQDVLIDAYPEEEFWQDLLKVTGGQTDERLARLVIRESARCRDWMRRHGVHFQPSLSGTLHLRRTNAFFMGGGKALVNAYYRSAEALGVRVRYDAPVDRLETGGRPLRRCARRRASASRRAPASSRAAASSRTASGCATRGAATTAASGPPTTSPIRGTRYNMGVVLRDLIARGADAVGDPTQSHCVAIDARAPLYDGGICTRVDCVSLGIMVNRDAQRFYDEGEDFWPKRYAIWGRLVALQPGQIGYSIIDAKAMGRFMPPVFPGREGADPARSSRASSALREAAVREDGGRLQRGVPRRHASTMRCSTTAAPRDSRRPRPIGRGRSTRRRSTATRSSRASRSRTSACKVDERAAVHFGGRPSANLFAAGEMMAGNVLGKGYTAGVGMTIGTVFGRVAGASAAAAAKGAPRDAA